MKSAEENEKLDAARLKGYCYCFFSFFVVVLLLASYFIYKGSNKTTITNLLSILIMIPITVNGITFALNAPLEKTPKVKVLYLIMTLIGAFFLFDGLIRALFFNQTFYQNLWSLVCGTSIIAMGAVYFIKLIITKNHPSEG